MAETRCEDCGVIVHLENEGVLVSAGGDHFVCPECAPKYEHIFPQKVWDAALGCWANVGGGER